MGSEDGLVEIHPRELQFLFEVKKQSSCSVHLVNKTDDYVAFKVKTTSPKKYCVRPNTGVILPRETCDFTVIMQAQRTATPDLQIKDKFLVQTTVIPFGTSEEGIVPAFFSKESGRYIEENKLRVVLVSATQPEVQKPVDGVSTVNTAVEVPLAKQTANIVHESPIVVNEVPLPHPLKASLPPLRESPDILNKIPLPEKETPVLRDFQIPSNEAPATSTESPFNSKETTTVSVESQFSSTETSLSLKDSPPLKGTCAPKEVVISSDEIADDENIHLSHVTDDVENLKSKLNNLQVKLEEAENLIMELREVTRTSIKERDHLQHEMVLLKSKGNSRSQAGFPLLFVVYMVILGVSLGYLLHF